ncbi:MAG: hypothetical protein ACPG8W_25915 [Candidatus Promineifilaceae bacterium]
MPRNGSDVYSLPPNTAAVTGDPISSAKFNSLTQDLETDQNTARPVKAGGTGATTAAAARSNLEIKEQFSTIALLVAATNLTVGDIQHTVDGQTWDIVAASTYTANSNTVYDLTGITGQAVSRRVDFKDDAELIADTRGDAAFSAGQAFTVTSNGTVFTKALSGASDHHRTTIGGVKLYEAGLRYTTLARFKEAVARSVPFRVGEQVSAAGKIYHFLDDANTDISGLTGWALFGPETSDNSDFTVDSSLLATRGTINTKFNSLGKSGFTQIGSVVEVTTAVASVEFTLDTTTYRNFQVNLDSVTPATDGDHIYIQFSPDDGATWRTTGYIGFGYRGGSATAYSLGAIAGGNLSNTVAAGGCSTRTFIYSAGDATRKTRTACGGHNSYSVNTTPYHFRSAMQYNTAEAHDKLRLIASSGNITSGRIWLLGEAV